MGLFKAHPCNTVSKTYRVTQVFGARPEYYKMFTCHGVPFRGHEGVDFGTPEGTRIVAVADGVVLEADNAASSNYGKYVKLRHSASGGFETIYAHLSVLSVAVGQTVAAGTQIGKSGNTGNSDGPHLHFSLRLEPNDRMDGWCGCSDPAYHLDAVGKRELAYHGVQFQRSGLPRHVIDLLAQWQPAVVLFIDPDINDVRRVREVCPATTVVGRVYSSDGEVSQRILSDPVAAGRWMHELSMRNGAVAAGLIDYVQVTNEVCQFWDQLPKLNDAEIEAMRLMDSAGVAKRLVLNKSVGNLHMPEEDRLAYYRQVYTMLAYAEQYGHAAGAHQYGARDLWGPKERFGPDADKWLINRLQAQVLWRLPFRRLKWIINETGIDGLLLPEDQRGAVVNETAMKSLIGFNREAAMAQRQAQTVTRGYAGPAGWQRYTTAEDYVRQLIQLGEEQMPWRTQVLGTAIFGWWMSDPWPSYDIDGGTAEGLARHYAGVALPPAPVPAPVPEPTPIPIPEPPNAGVEGAKTMEIYDMHGERRDMDWLQRTYGGKITFLNAGPGRKFRLVRIDETEGPATLKVRVLNEQGEPHVGQPVANFWPDLSQMTDLRNKGLATLWQNFAIHQSTGGDGFTGFGLGRGDYIGDLAKGGEHTVWVLSPSLASDGITNLGMLGGTEHRGPLFLTFQIGVGAETLEQALIWHADEAQAIEFNQDAALQKQIARDGFVPNSNEVWVEWDGQQYAVQRAEHLQSGAVRVYFCPIGRWDQVRFVVRR